MNDVYVYRCEAYACKRRGVYVDLEAEVQPPTVRCSSCSFPMGFSGMKFAATPPAEGGVGRKIFTVGGLPGDPNCRACGERTSSTTSSKVRGRVCKNPTCEALDLVVGLARVQG